MSPSAPPVPVTREPFNAETPPEALREALTPTESFFVRNHFPMPRFDGAPWRLDIDVAHERRSLSLEDLRALPAHEVTTVLECAGNARSLLEPAPPGVRWGTRAVGCAVFSGPRLRDVLAGLTVRESTVELLFQGADAGEVEGRHVRYERSLPLAKAYEDDVIIALDMNGAPLTHDHGAPARLVVPGWYAVASVKWLVAIRALSEPFDGFYQSHHYVYKPRDGPESPVREARVKALIVTPHENARARLGAPVVIEGKAWSGRAPVARVEVSTDGGATWHAAGLRPSDSPRAWRDWHTTWTPRTPGRHVLFARATDASGATQPDEAPWNALGYGNNVIHSVHVDVE